MDFEVLITIGQVVGSIVTIAGAIKYIPMGYRWLRSWTIVKRDEYDKLKTFEKDHRECEEQRIRTRETIAKAVRESMERSRQPRTRVESEFDPRLPFKNPK